MVAIKKLLSRLWSEDLAQDLTECALLLLLVGLVLVSTVKLMGRQIADVLQGRVPVGVVNRDVGCAGTAFGIRNPRRRMLSSLPLAWVTYDRSSSASRDPPPAASM